MTDQEELLKQIENMQKGSRNKLEARLKERNATLCNIIPMNENINLGSQLFNKGPLYWNAITVEENGKKASYIILNYLRDDYKKYSFLNEN